MEQIRTGVIIVAGGSGRRMGASLPKQFLFLEGQPLLAHTINRLHEALPTAPIVVVLPADQIDYWRNLSARFEVARHTLTAGGKERFDSVRAGLEALLNLGEGVELVAIHDGVRPLVSVEMIHRGLECAARQGSAIPVTPAIDSCRRLTEQGSEIIDRTPLRFVQTPQIFAVDPLRHAYRQPYRPAFTDDASVVEQAGYPIHLYEGERWNLKITTREDLALAEALLTRQNDEREDL